MRWTQSLIPTQKEIPADAQIVSHQLMVRAGLIRQLTAGAYDFLPLGYRSLRKATAIVREEMDKIASEILLPALQPAELWQKTGRDVSYGDNLMKFKDRHGRLNVLGPTHEEVVTELVSAFINSYKQLPLSLYQIQTKFRDEYRPRFGLLRVREFLMKDAYSFHADVASLDKIYDGFYAAYERIFTRCGIPFVVVEAESGPIGGSASHEFMVGVRRRRGHDRHQRTRATTRPTSSGPRSATGRRRSAATPRGTLERVHTPGVAGRRGGRQVHEGQDPEHLLKTLVYQDRRPRGRRRRSGDEPQVGGGGGPRRPRRERVEAAAAAGERFGVSEVALVDDPEVRAEWTIGFVGPDAAARNERAVLLVDPDAAQPGFWATGANEADYHYKYFNWFRECGDALADPKKTAVADIRNAAGGDPSPRNDGGNWQPPRASRSATCSSWARSTARPGRQLPGRRRATSTR